MDEYAVSWNVGNAHMLDAAMSVSLGAIVPGAFVKDIESAVRTVIERDDPEANVRVEVLHGATLSEEAFSEADAGRALGEGEFFQLRLEGERQGFAFVGIRTGVVGVGSDEQCEFLSHLSETMEWFVSSLRVGPRRPYVLTETRGRLLEVSGGRFRREGASELLITPGKPVQLSDGVELWVETSLTCPTMGRAVVSDMVKVTPLGAIRLTATPWNVALLGKEL